MKINGNRFTTFTMEDGTSSHTVTPLTTVIQTMTIESLPTEIDVSGADSDHCLLYTSPSPRDS